MSNFHVEVYQPSFPDGGYRLFFGVDDELEEPDLLAVAQAAVDMGYAHVEASGYDISKVKLGVSKIIAVDEMGDIPGHEPKGTTT